MVSVADPERFLPFVTVMTSEFTPRERAEAAIVPLTVYTPFSSGAETVRLLLPSVAVNVLSRGSVAAVKVARVPETSKPVLINLPKPPVTTGGA